MKKLMAILLAAALTLSMAACSSAQNAQPQTTPQDETEKVVKIGILQQLEHGALDAARQGFIDALADNGYVEGENLEIDYT